MDEAVEVPSGLFYRLPHLIVAVEIENIGDEVEGILIVLNFGVQTRQVEAVCEIILVDLAKVLVPSRRDKLNREIAVSRATEGARTRRGKCPARPLQESLLSPTELKQDGRSRPARAHTQSLQ